MRVFRSKRRVRREAAHWVARLGGGASEGEHAAFRAWYEADANHAQAYDRMAAIWSASGQLRASAPEERIGRGAPRRRLVLAIAASVLAVTAIAFLLRGAAPGSEYEASISYATSQGELKEVVLPDGSKVLLDAGSRVEAAFSGTERRLLLREGRARFTVAHEDRPFIVQAGGQEVVATGTVFDVSLLDARLSVVMLEGSVEIRTLGGPARTVRRISAGQRLVVRGPGAGASTPAMRSDTVWASHMLEFDDLPLSDAVAMANRYSRTQIRLDGDALRTLRVTGAFRAGDAAGLARALAAAFGLELSIDPDGQLRLSRRAGPR